MNSVMHTMHFNVNIYYTKSQILLRRLIHHLVNNMNRSAFRVLTVISDHLPNKV